LTGLIKFVVVDGSTYVSLVVCCHVGGWLRVLTTQPVKTRKRKITIAGST